MEEWNPSSLRTEVLKAESRSRPHIRETPLEESIHLSRETGSRVFLKMENLQISGSFKFRGAANKLLSMDKQSLAKGVVTASSGNHGSAFAVMARRLGIQGTIYLPETALPAKIDTLRDCGAEIRLFGDDCIKAELEAKAEAERTGLTFISPYNDPQIIGGQGTVGIELERRMENIDAVLVPVGGGGLISGIAGYLKAQNPAVEIIGCLPVNSAVMYESVKAGRILDLESLPTISDGTAGGIEPGSITFEICRDLVDDFILLTEEEIISALKLIIRKHYILIEGAAALPVAALLQQPDRFKGKSVALVLSGAKISLEALKKIL